MTTREHVGAPPALGMGSRAGETSRTAPQLNMSVVICTRDRPESLLRCVASVMRQTVIPYELIVVNDGQLSPDCRESLARLCAAARVRFVCLDKTVPGLPASRNLAVSHARGDIVQFLDDDVEIDPEFCGHILGLYERDAAQAVLGIDAELIDPPSMTARAFESVYRSAGWWALPPKQVRRPPLPAALRDRRWAVPVRLLSGACMSFRRTALLDHPFDETLNGYALGEDREMSLRLHRRGWLLRSRGARAFHRHDPAGRPDAFQFGRMTVRNYVHIMRRASRTSPGDWMVISYSFAVIAAWLFICSLARPRRYLPELMGVGRGLAELMSGQARRMGILG